MELKTLKDIYEDAPTPHHNLEAYNRLLREEAIKWIKSNNTGGFSFVIDFDGKVSKHNRKKKNMNSIDWVNLGEMIGFINFFNITEEDLK